MVDGLGMRISLSLPKGRVLGWRKDSRVLMRHRGPSHTGTPDAFAKRAPLFFFLSFFLHEQMKVLLVSQEESVTHSERFNHSMSSERVQMPCPLLCSPP